MGILALSADERVADVEVTEDVLSVRMRDGRIISVPLVWYPRLLRASETARKNWAISGGGYGIHWPDIDEDLSTEGLLRGAPAPQHTLMPKPHRRVLVKDEKELTVEQVNRGIWDYLAESEESANDVVSLLTALGENTQALTGKIETHTTRLTKLNKARGSAQQVRGVAASFATDLNSYSTQVEQLLPNLDKGIESLESILTAIVDSIEPSEPDSTEAIDSIRSQVEQFLAAVRPTKESIIELQRTFRKFKQENLTAQLTKASSRLLITAEGLLESYIGLESFGLKIMFRIRERFEENK
jgi:hypothetical protein